LFGSTNFKYLFCVPQIPAVVSALKETAFVPSAKPPLEGAEPLLHKPSDLLDPSNALLRRVFFDEPARFAGGEFASERWLPILREAGLKSSMDGNLYLECGKKIEARAKEGYQSLTPVQPFVTEEERRFRRTYNQALARANQAPVSAKQPSCNQPSGAPGSGEPDRELLETAELLLEKMLGEFANVYGPAFCEAFSQIACVPAERIDFKTVGAAGGPSRRTTEVRTVLASYRESVLAQDWPLAWSSAPVLKDERVIPPAFAWGALKLRSPPAYSTVIAHLKILGQNGGEDLLARWGGITGARTAGSHVSVEDAYLAVFRFLYSKWDGLSASEREMLRGVPFIPVANGTRLVAPDRLYARARTDLAPFAFELPRAFTPYLRILEVVGTGDAPTPDGLLKLIAQVSQQGEVHVVAGV
jgi:sacsin